MIEQQEWESIYAAIRSGNGRSEIAEGTVIDHDADGVHVYVSGFGSEPVAISALEYTSSIYRGAIKSTVRSEPSLPEIGARVMVARPGGSMHRPRIIGIVREDMNWKQPEDIQVLELDESGNAFVQGTLYAYRGVEVERVSEFDSAFKTWEEGDSSPPRFQLRADGFMEWGPGSAGFDTNLYRGAANQLKTDDNLVVGGGGLNIGPDSSANSGIEIGNSVASTTTTPYIDFHLGNQGAEDYNVRLINDADGTLRLNGRMVITAGLDVQDDVILDGGRIQFGTGTSARDFTALKKATGTHNPASLAAHSGNVYGITLPSGTCVTGDLVIGFGIADPGNRGVQFHAEPTTGNDVVNVWAFNADSVALDHGTLTFHFVILKL